MGRYINYYRCGTQEQLDMLRQSSPDIVEIDNAKVYWSPSSNGFLVVTNQDWVDYLTGQSTMIPFPEPSSNSLYDKVNRFSAEDLKSFLDRGDTTN